MPMSLKFEHVVEEVVSNYPKDQRRVLQKLTGRKLSVEQASDAWPRILEHKWLLSERLGRDVGLRVAALDYFDNVRPPIRMRSGQGGLPPRPRFMEPFRG
jgi:hypothetical protein